MVERPDPTRVIREGRVEAPMRPWVVGWETSSGEFVFLLPGYRLRWNAERSARRANKVRVGLTPAVAMRATVLD